ncbi:MAG TPA: metal-dependent hydrolase [Spirochaetia bacterium]|nr:metal-dependent hydrolase [Spirochaetia bacterium]
MFLLAHTGITSGAAWLINRYAKSRENAVVPEERCGDGSYLFTAYPQAEPENMNNVDFRLIILGSILPDIIDKPFELFFPHLGMGTGRGVAHTLLFALILLIIGTYHYRRGRPGFLYMALASAGHLVLDRMWQMPKVLLWPLYGFSFPVVGKPGLGQIPVWWHMLLGDPWVYVSEVIGGLILLLLFVRLWRCGGLGDFVREGRIS